MSLSTGSTCHGYSVTGAASAPSSPTKGSVFCWMKSTADNSIHRTALWLDSADGAGPSTGVQFGTDGNDGVATRVAEGGTIVANAISTNYWWQGANRNSWIAVAGWFDCTASALDAGTYWGTAGTTDAVNIGAAVSGLLDDLYILRNRNVGTGWGGVSDDSQPNLRIAHLAYYDGYVLTSGDMTSLAAGTNPQDIGGGTLLYYWTLENAAGGLTDEITGVTIAPFGGSATATWYDADNPTVSAPSGGGGGSSIGAAAHYYRQMQ